MLRRSLTASQNSCQRRWSAFPVRDNPLADENVIFELVRSKLVTEGFILAVRNGLSGKLLV